MVGVSFVEVVLGLLVVGECFDLLFIDVNLGLISGIEVVNWVCSLYF